LVAGIVDSNPAQGMGVCLCASVLCSVYVEAFAIGWLIQWFPNWMPWQQGVVQIYINKFATKEQVTNKTNS
jgi:hypothetical protein